MVSRNPTGKRRERAAAFDVAQPYYFTGRPCSRGHVVERFTSTGNCTLCVSIVALAWSAANREKVNRSSRESMARNREQRLIRKSNLRQEHPEIRVADQAIRRARLKNAAPKWLTREHRMQMRAFYKQARELTVSTGTLHEVDHIVPLAGENVCGLHVPWNLQVLTGKANAEKRNSHAKG